MCSATSGPAAERPPTVVRPLDVVCRDLLSFSSIVIGDVVVVARTADGQPTGVAVTPAGVARGNLPAVLPSSLAVAQPASVCAYTHIEAHHCASVAAWVVAFGLADRCSYACVCVCLCLFVRHTHTHTLSLSFSFSLCAGPAAAAAADTSVAGAHRDAHAGTAHCL
jgi:uncharacterized membrane protein YbhN (UPF0104 family)